MKCTSLLVLLAVLAGTAAAGQSTHKLVLTFDYDFTHQPSCSAETDATKADNDKKDKKGQKECVQQFIAYDISAGVAKRTKLVSIPVPQGANGMVKGISATTPLLLFESGQHLIAVVAQTPNGNESDPNRCTFWITIPDSASNQH